MGPSPGEYNPNHPPIVMQQIFNSRRIRDASRLQPNHAIHQRNKHRGMQNYSSVSGNVPILHHPNYVPPHTQQYSHRPVSGYYSDALPTEAQDTIDPLAYASHEEFLPGPLPFEYEEAQYVPQDYVTGEREMLFSISNDINISPTATHRKSMTGRVSCHYSDTNNKQNSFFELDKSYASEQSQLMDKMAIANNIRSGDLASRSFDDAWKTDRIQYQLKRNSRSCEEAFGSKSSHQNVCVSTNKGIARFKKSNKIPKYDDFCVEAEIGTSETDWGFDHQQVSIYDDVLLPVYSTICNDESVITNEVCSSNLAEELRHDNSATDWEISQGFDYSVNQQDFGHVDRKQVDNHGIAFFQRRQNQSVPLHSFGVGCGVTNDEMINETQYRNGIAVDDDLLFNVNPSYKVDHGTYSSPSKRAPGIHTNFNEFELPSVRSNHESLPTEFDRFQPLESSTISQSKFVSMHVSRQSTSNAPPLIVNQSFYRNESIDDGKANTVFDEQFLGGERGNIEFPHQDYSKANRYSIRYVSEAIEVDIENGPFFSPNSGTRCLDEKYDTIETREQGQTGQFTTKTREQHDIVDHAAINVDSEDEIDLQGLNSLWG
jgi:hypothetical protein